MFISGAGDTKYGKEVHVHDLQQFSWKDPTEVIESNCLTIERLPKVKAYFWGQKLLVRWQDWGINHCCRKHVPVFHYACSKYIFPNV